MLVLIAKKNGVTSKVFVEFLIAMSIIIFLYRNIAFIRKILIIIQSSDIILKNISKEYLDEFFISTTVLVLL